MSNKMTATDECAICMKPLPKSESMRCSACKAGYDLDCINMSTQRFYSFYKLDKQRRDAWKCLECKKSKPSRDQNVSLRPVLSPEQGSNVTHRTKSTPKTITHNQGGNLKPEDTTHTPEDKMTALATSTDLKQFWEEMRAMRAEMSMFRSAMSDLTTAINSRLDAIENRVEILEATIDKSDGHIISNLEETIMQLKLEIDDRDQEMLVNDVEIANFPETNNENSTHIILTVATKLGVDLDERDVVSAQRVGAPRAAVERGERRGPAQRDALLQAARVRRRITTDDVLPSGFPTPSAFYINERLTRRNRQLFQKTREVAKRVNWKYVWTRDGKVFARQETGKARHRLSSEADVYKVFGVNAVSED